MKLLITICIFLITSLSFGQYYSNIGPFNTPVHTDIGEMDFVISESGVPYVFYVDGGTNRGNVKYWNGSSWVLYGTADFTLTNISDLDIEVYWNGTTDKVLVSMRQGGTYFEAFYWTGTTWFAHGYWDDGFGPYQLTLSAGWDFDVEWNHLGSAVLMIGNGPQNAVGYISPAGTGVWQLASTYDQNPVGTKFDLEFGPNGNSWLVTSLSTNNTIVQKNTGTGFTSVGPLYSTNLSSDDVAISAYSVAGTATVAIGGIKNNPGPNEHFLYHAKATLAAYQTQDVLVNGTGTWADEFDVAAFEDYTYYINRKGTNVAVIQINNTTNTVSFTHTNLGVTGTLTDVEIELNPTNHFPVIAFKDASGQLWVRELWESVTIVCDDPNPSFCSGEGGNYGDWIVLTSNNLDNNEITMDAISDDPSIISGILQPGPIWWDLDVPAPPHRSTSFTTGVTVSAYTEDGLLDVDNQYNITALAKDSLINNFTLSQMCTNYGAVNMNNYLFPNGGVFTGSTSGTGIFDPVILGVGSHFVHYEQVNATGCLNYAHIVIDVFESPSASVTATGSGCSDSTGTASVSVTGGVAPYAYYWTTGADSTNLSGLPAGSYTVTVTDNLGCITSGVANVQNSSINLMATPTNIDCAGLNTGAIDLTIAGTGPFDILWSNGYGTEDITGLAAGTYDVTVEDANGCVSTETYEVAGPNPIIGAVVTTNTSCAGSDGAAIVTPSGGTSPYTLEFFNNSGVSQGATLLNVASGAYSIQITDDLGCTSTQNFVINETGGPNVIVNQITNASCLNDGGIDIGITTSGSIVSTIWNTGATTEDLSNIGSGLYTVTVVDNGGCTSTLNVNVNAELPSTPEICVVTVDSITTTNLIVWEKPISSNISHFNICREGSQAGVYQKVDSVLYSEDSKYNDWIASPMVRSWRYKISTVDNCGTESLLSDYHKTVHMTINLGLGGNINLHWDAYEGLTYTQWTCFRHTNTNGFELLWTNASTIFSYTDIPPSTGGLDYVIGFDLPFPCTSSVFKAQDYNGTRSNRSAGVFNGSGLSLNELEMTDFDVTLFPNPNNGLFRVHITGVANGSFEYMLIDMTGKIVEEGKETLRVFDKDFSNLEKGMYYMTITNNGVVNTQKVVIQ